MICEGRWMRCFEQLGGELIEVLVHPRRPELLQWRSVARLKEKGKAMQAAERSTFCRRMRSPLEIYVTARATIRL